MTIYEQNLKALAQKYPQMDKLIEEAQENIKEDLLLIEDLALNEKRILKIKKEGHIFYLNGKRNTEDPAKKWIESLGELQENAPVLMMGLGNETYFHELMKSTEKHLAIIIYEPSLQIFLDFINHYPLAKWLKKHTIVFWVEGITGMTIESLGGIIQGVLSYEMLPFSKILVLPNYETLFPKESLAFIKQCHDIVEKGLVHYNTKVRFAEVLVKNLFANTIYLCDGYKTTQLPLVIPRNIPGIVVAAGPSLNKNIHELKKAKGKALIIAVDTAIKPLLKAGIVPDMFYIVDAKKPLELISAEEAKDIPLVTTLDAASEILQYHTGMKFFANEGIRFVDHLFFRCDREIGEASDGGSVATAAFTLLFKIGIQTIILVGQDLAFTNNRSHADGTFHEEMPEQDTRNFIMVDGNNGEKVPTRPDFQVYLNWYNMYIEGCKKHNPAFRVINATEGGAKIQNTEIMTLKEALNEVCVQDINIQECLEKLPPLFKGDDRLWVIEQLKKIPEDCRTLSEDAQKTVGLYKELDIICKKKKLNQKSFKSICKKLENQIKKIENQDMYQLVTLTLNEAQYIIRNEQFLSYDSAREEGLEIARKGILYMGSVSKCAQVFAEYADSVYGDWKQMTPLIPDNGTTMK